MAAWTKVAGVVGGGAAFILNLEPAPFADGLGVEWERPGFEFSSEHL